MRNVKAAFVGTWKLVSVTAATFKSDVNKVALGRNPSGLLTYTADGRMMEIISDDARKPLWIAGRVAAPTEERAKAYSTFMAYAGRYTFTCDKVVTHVEIALLQNWVNTEQTQLATLQGDRMFVTYYFGAEHKKFAASSVLPVPLYLATCG